MYKSSKGDKDFIFLERTAFDSAFHELTDTKRTHIHISWIYGAIASLGLSLITSKDYRSILGIPAEKMYVFILILIGILILLLVIFNIRKRVNKEKGFWEVLNLELIKKELIKKSEDLNMYTILLIIPDFSGQGVVVLAKAHTEWENAIFLPYINYSSKEHFDTLYNIEDEINNYLNTEIKIGWEYLDEMDLYNEIKYHKNERILRRYNYKFVLVYPKSNFLVDIFIKELAKNHNFKFYQLDNMACNLNTMLRNKEVIGKMMEKKVYLKKEFNVLQRASNRLLWNISEQCDENCEFCAFGNAPDDVCKKIEVKSIIQKLQKIKIDTIDISTGNIVDIGYLRDCIIELKKSGYSVNLTATSKTINALDVDFIKQNISIIEFTYDSININEYRSSDYNPSNFACIENLAKQLRNEKKIKFRALVIIYLHLSIEMLREISKKLRDIGVTEIRLIRLMPVGFMSNKEYPEKLRNKKYYEDYYEHCKNDKIMETHCSLDGLNGNTKYCNKGINKLSMSPSGELYNCPWGEHLQGGDKLFYLGDIIKDDIVNIINNQDFSHMNKKTFSCEIFNMKQDEDFLYK